MDTLTELKGMPASNGFKGFLYISLIAFMRIAGHPLNLAFSIGLPIVMYLIFGVGKDYSSIELPHGNVSAQIMLNMAFYGVVIGASTVSVGTTLERANGVSRLYSTTPLSSFAFILSRMVASLGVVTIAIVATFSVGALTEARLDAHLWPLTGLLLVLSTVLASLLGLSFGFIFRSDAAYGGVSGVTVISAFLAGIFLPLEQMSSFFQDLAPYSPFYGAIMLVSAPLYGEAVKWSWVFNVVVWCVIFASISVLARRYDTGR
ncbi:ABC transporter permease [Gleimia sp. 6138-11-ORH1]|uniref:ABC transporter permease n=1 Tax=Gleimia sp. 6138-11-ORH1 TaxID=2973937 RepID=UPI00216A5781|nr:ABC transporter permease [Gleimia sp. 6138-11-ORH1]MCS4484179.1 ABC transporter permease [Gleimia sp. 6138-11-ORH1]